MTNLDLHTQFLSISEQFSVLKSNLETIKLQLAIAMPKSDERLLAQKAMADNVRKKVCKHFKITLKQMDSSDRREDFIKPRHAAIWICYKKLKLGVSEEIATIFKRDRTTILNATQTHMERMETNKHFRAEMEILLKECEG